MVKKSEQRYRGPKISEAIEALIVKLHRDHPKWTAKEIRNDANRRLQEKDPNLPLAYPSLSAVQKILQDVRRRQKELPTFPEDKLWSMATLNEHPISMSAIPTVIELWKARGYKLTIRDAKWIARLSPLITDVKKLDYACRAYSQMEQLYNLIDRPFDSTKYDKAFIAGENIEIDGLDMIILLSPEDGLSKLKNTYLTKLKTRGRQ